MIRTVHGMVNTDYVVTAACFVWGKGAYNVTQTVIQKIFAPMKKLLPKWLAGPIRSTGTAFLTPLLYSYRTGHFRSSFRMAAVTKEGEPLPWYTYPSIDFLKYRTYEKKTVLEFGGGQSTFWWAMRAERVVTLEGNREWYEQIRGKMPANVELHFVSMEDRDTNVACVKETINAKPYREYDVIIIDGLFRSEMIEIACDRLAHDGIIICDNAEGYGFYEGFKDRGMKRVDFYGNAPGVILPHCTSIYFSSSSFVFGSTIPIHVVANE